MINYPKKQSEFEIQSTLFSQLKLNGFNAKGEVSADNCRLDIVVFSDDSQDALCIIETKSWVYKKKPNETIQLLKYSKFDIPIIVCGSIDKIFRTLRRVEKIYNNYNHGKKQGYRLY